MYGTGFFPTDRSNIYAIESDELYLTGTSEVALAGLHMGEVLGGAAAPLHGVLDELPPRGRRRRQGHARHVPRAPVQQGGAVHVLRARPGRPTSTSGCSRSRRRSCRRSGSRTASSTSPPATSARPPRRSTTARAGSRSSSATASSRRRRTRPTSRRAASASATATGKSLEPVHTLNGTAATDRAVLAILENFQGERAGRPARVRRARYRQRANSGGVPERSNGTVLKTVVGSRPRGFESLPRRLILVRIRRLNWRHLRAEPFGYGAMLWLWRKTFSGSTRRLTSTRRS